MSPLFADFAKQEFGYDVSFGFADAPFLRPVPARRDLAGDPLGRVQHHHLGQPMAGRLRRAGLDRQRLGPDRGASGTRHRMVLADRRELLPGLPGRHRTEVGLPAAGRHHRALRPQGHAGGPGRARRLPSAARPRPAADLRGFRRADDGPVPRHRGLLQPPGPEPVRHGDAVQPGIRLHQLLPLSLHVQPWRRHLESGDRPGPRHPEQRGERRRPRDDEGLAAVHAAGCRQLRHRRGDRRVQPGAGVLLLPVGGRRPRHDHG